MFIYIYFGVIFQTTAIPVTMAATGAQQIAVTMLTPQDIAARLKENLPATQVQLPVPNVSSVELSKFKVTS